MSTAAEKKKSVSHLLEAVHDAVAGFKIGKPSPSIINKLRKAAAALGARTELDDFMRDRWGMTIRVSKKRKKA